ncbi:hypothetical protein BC567DRAFT_219874 [Phyllosticta citribraziliensis]
MLVLLGHAVAIRRVLGQRQSLDVALGAIVVCPCFSWIRRVARRRQLSVGIQGRECFTGLCLVAQLGHGAAES